MPIIAGPYLGNCRVGLYQIDGRWFVDIGIQYRTLAYIPISDQQMCELLTKYELVEAARRSGETP